MGTMQCKNVEEQNGQTPLEKKEWTNHIRKGVTSGMIATVAVDV